MITDKHLTLVGIQTELGVIWDEQDSHSVYDSPEEAEQMRDLMRSALELAERAVAIWQEDE